MFAVTEAPTVLGNVPTLDGDDLDGLMSYLETSTPVVARGAQKGAPIAELATESAATEVLGQLIIQVQQNYTSQLTMAGASHDGRAGLSQKVRNEIRDMRLGDYLRHVARDPGSDLFCAEYHTPGAVLDMLRIPPCCERLPCNEPLVSFMFVANQGNYAHLHFDGDYRHVLLYQVFGRKRVVMVPLSATDKISPAMNFSKLLIQNMSEAEKLDLFKYLGAYDCIIEPGDMVHFPPSIWHYVDYIDTSMSVNFRFGRDEITQRFVDANRVPFYPELHQLLDRLGNLDPAERVRIAEQMWPRVVATLARDYPTTTDRHRAVESLYRKLLHEVPSVNDRPRQLTTACPVAEAMAVERYESPSRRWREELALGAPL